MGVCYIFFCLSSVGFLVCKVRILVHTSHSVAFCAEDEQSRGAFGPAKS